MDRAACVGVDPEIFFPEPSSSPLPAKRVCVACPWGAMTPKGRRKLEKAPRRRHVSAGGSWQAWDDADDDRLRLLAGQNLSNSEIGRRMGRSVSSISYRRAALGLPPSTHRGRGGAR